MDHFERTLTTGQGPTYLPIGRERIREMKKKNKFNKMLKVMFFALLIAGAGKFFWVNFFSPWLKP